MDKTALRNFAVESRRQLIKGVEEKLLLLGFHKKGIDEGIDLKSKIKINEVEIEKEQYNQLKNRYLELGYDELVERTAYTWFNRFVALRFMELNGYIDEAMTEGKQPKILDDYPEASFFSDLSSEKQHEIHILRDGEKLEELYAKLLDYKCNELNRIMPFIFEEKNNYTELLIPSNLLRKDSFLESLKETIQLQEGILEVEVIGWLYQFYNSEKKAEVFEGLKKNQKITKENIPAATQLFTPKWIVKYMAENSLGKLAVESLGVSESLKKNWKYYIESEKDSDVEKLKIEDIKIMDPAMGSGHMLTYCFDLLFEIYEDLGWTKKEAVLSILSNNLYGLEIDERAGQLASFALMMKGREKFPRLFRTLQNIEDNEKLELCTVTIQESNTISGGTKKLLAENKLKNLEKLIENFHDAKEYGSILKLEKIEKEIFEEEMEKLKKIYDKIGQKSLFGSDLKLAESWNMSEDLEKLEKLIVQQEIMTEKFDVVITNPPYMGVKGYTEKLQNYCENNYINTKRDFYLIFCERVFFMIKEKGIISLITPESWMFLPSGEFVRKNILTKYFIDSLVHLGLGVFESGFGTVAFVIKNKTKKIEGNYIDLTKGKDCFEKENEYLKSKKIYRCNQESFIKIPDSPISYWATTKVINLFENLKFEEIGKPRQGMATSNNDLFLKVWNEINIKKIGFNIKTILEAKESQKKWFPYNKGGTPRKWYGNSKYVLNYENDGREVKIFAEKLYKNYSRTIKNIDFYFKKGITYSDISGLNFAGRYTDNSIFDVKGSTIFVNEKYFLYFLSFFNCSLVPNFIKIINPTITTQVGDLKRVPIIITKNEKEIEKIELISRRSIFISKAEWDSRETSWDFGTSPLFGGDKIVTAYESYCSTWKENFYQMHRNEEELNRLFIEIYDLQDEMDEKVDLEDITLLKKESSIVDGELHFNREEIIKQFISYCVGVIMGRYSLDKPGLIIANSDDRLVVDGNSYSIIGEDGELRHRIDNARYIPEREGIVLNSDETIVARLEEVIKAIYGEQNHFENMEFIAEALGRKKDESSRDTIRKYMINDFMKDHVQRYQRRPIYWLFTSGKNKGFNALIYMHRYNPMSVPKLRTDYLLKYQEKLELILASSERELEQESNSKAKKDLEKRIKALRGDLDEIKKYDSEIKNMAEKKLAIDLDDGVKVNYEKFGKLLYKI